MIKLSNTHESNTFKGFLFNSILIRLIIKFTSSEYYYATQMYEEQWIIFNWIFSGLSTG